MTKPNLKNSFSVEDIHKLREYHYETTKNFSEKEFIDDINKKAEKFKKELNRNTGDSVAI